MMLLISRKYILFKNKIKFARTFIKTLEKLKVFRRYFELYTGEVYQLQNFGVSKQCITVILCNLCRTCFCHNAVSHIKHTILCIARNFTMRNTTFYIFNRISLFMTRRVRVYILRIREVIN